MSEIGVTTSSEVQFIVRFEDGMDIPVDSVEQGRKLSESYKKVLSKVLVRVQTTTVTDWTEL